MELLINIVTAVTIGLLILGLGAYGILLIGYMFNVAQAKKIVDEWQDHTFEVPMSGVAAFAIVSMLRASENGALEFKAFGLEFDGPAGPTTLWVVVYLTIVVSFKLLKKGAK